VTPEQRFLKMENLLNTVIEAQAEHQKQLGTLLKIANTGLKAMQEMRVSIEELRVSIKETRASHAEDHRKFMDSLKELRRHLGRRNGGRPE
jgi:hypothetical protein